MDRDTILKQIERYEKLVAAVGNEAGRRSILKLLEKERAKLEAERKNGIRLNHHFALACDLCMIFPTCLRPP